MRYGLLLGHVDGRADEGVAKARPGDTDATLALAPHDASTPASKVTEGRPAPPRHTDQSGVLPLKALHDDLPVDDLQEACSM